MNLFALSGLLTGISCTIMGGIVYFTTHRSRVARVWAFFCLAISLWGFGALLIGLTPDAEVSIVWWRVAHVGVILIPVLFYHFVTIFADIPRRAVLAVAYIASVLLLFADTTPWFIAQTRQVFGQFYYDSPPTPLYVVFVAWFVGLTILSHVELWRFRHRATDEVKRRLVQWLFLGTTIGFAGGTTAFLPCFGLDLYPLGNFAVPLFPLFMTYALLRHRLIDVDVAVIRGLVFLAIYAVVVVVPFVVGSIYRSLWETALGEWWWVAPVVLMGLLASASPILFMAFVNRIERDMMKAQRRYHRTLIAASSGMTRIKDLRKLCRLIVYVVNKTVGLTNSGLFLYDAKQEAYPLAAVRYQRVFPKDLGVSKNDPLIEIVNRERDLVVLEEVRENLTVGQKGGEDWTRKLDAVYTWMRTLEIKLIVPSFTNNRLLGFLALGAKRNGEPYTTDDIAIFSGLANQAALGIENAFFFEELKSSEAYMIQSEKLASLGQLASGMAHEIHNPLTIISGEAQLYLERFKSKDGEVDQLLQSIIEECHRAADITRRILRFAKPAPTELGPVDVRTIADETLTLAGYQVRMDRVERTVEIPPDLPKIRGNQNQLQEVLLNLVINACQAMGEKGGSLQISASLQNGQIEIRVADTGPGIPANKLTKIFDPFYTTKATGTGLGLFVTQRIVRLHQGSIDVRSTEGKGTTFIIRLPALAQPAAAPIASPLIASARPAA